MLTEFGKELRKLRIDCNEKLLEMAKRLQLSAGFISLVEVGKKNLPIGFEEQVVNVYDLDDYRANVLRRAADMSRKAFTLEPATPLARDTAGLLARKLNDLSVDQLNQIQHILGALRD